MREQLAQQVSSPWVLQSLSINRENYVDVKHPEKSASVCNFLLRKDRVLCSDAVTSQKWTKCRPDPLGA